MKTYSPYPSYKPSGIDWLGDIPQHWEVRKLKFVADCFPSNVDKHSKDNEQQVKLCNYTDVYKNDYIRSNMNFMIATASDEQIKRFALQKDDVIITKDSETANDIAIPALVKEDLENVICGYHLSMLRPNNQLSGSFLFRTLQCKAINIQFEVSSQGVTRVGLGVYDMKKARIPLPNLEEQATIARFLDYKLAKIDRFIRKKKQLIQLLNEQKAAIINQAVTKGLDTHSPMKPSGIEWLGDIPKHWEVRKLKYVLKSKLKYGANEPGGDLQKDDPRYIRITDFDKSGNLRNDTFCSLKEDLAAPYLLKNGDILFARSGATVGKTFQFKNYEGKACYAGYLIKAEPDEEVILSDFLYQYTCSGVYDRWKNFIFNKATIENIGADKYCNLPVIVPPLNEQSAIVAHIEQETAQLNALIQTVEQEIALTQEYRTALIAEAVTGKIDVRGYEVAEMEEEEEVVEMGEDIEEEIAVIDNEMS